jgi:hypothetical protein
MDDALLEIKVLQYFEFELFSYSLGILRLTISY